MLGIVLCYDGTSALELIRCNFQPIVRSQENLGLKDHPLVHSRIDEKGCNGAVYLYVWVRLFACEAYQKRNKVLT